MPTGPRIQFPSHRLVGWEQREDKSKKREVGSKMGGDSGGGSWRKHSSRHSVSEEAGLEEGD